MKKTFTKKMWAQKAVMLFLFLVIFGGVACLLNMSVAAGSVEKDPGQAQLSENLSEENEDISVGTEQQGDFVSVAVDSEWLEAYRPWEDAALAVAAVLPDGLRAPAATYTAWFDGTLGVGTTNSLVQNATNVKIQGETITAPVSAGSNSKYQLKGWYDIRSGNYVKPGQTVTLTQNTVFYADWILADYDLTPSNPNSVVSNQPDVSSFVRTDVFDYNELFNITHGAVATLNTGEYSHSETWRDSYSNQNKTFLFSNWYNNNLALGSLGFPNYLRTERNTFNGSNPYAITKNIVTGHNDPLIYDLFDPSSEDGSGRHYLGQGRQLFQYDNDGSTTGSRGFGEGYYYYDSDYNGADYNENEQRFYVYKTTQMIQGQNRYGNGWSNGDRKPGFMPFEQGTVMEKTGQTDYWFGMKTQVDFFLPDDVGSNGGDCNKSAANKDMRFYFSGDDDVWVFVDDTLVLDLGGIHERIAGDINFSTGDITYYQHNGAALSTDSTTLKTIGSGDHKLTIYYLERGSSWSNCSIYFNLAPRYELEITKEDGDTHALLPNAEFSVYKDEACTVPALLWDSAASYSSGDDPKNHFRTDDQGKISIYGLYANRTYYIKETDSPPSYPSISDKVIKLHLDSAGNASLQSGIDFAEISGHSGTHIGLLVENRKPEETSIDVQKKWYNEDGSPLTENVPESVRVQLYRKAIPDSGQQPGSGSGGGSNVSIPVNFSVQYFGGGHGTNMDTASLSQKINLKNMIVLSGGKLTFELDIQKRNFNLGSSDPDYVAGIYSVTANGRMISPTFTSGSSGQNCFIGGTWGNHPPLHGEYEIDNIEVAQDIVITLIGYMNYVPNTGIDSVKDTIALSAEAFDPAPPSEPPGSGGEPVVIPGVKPDDAVPYRDPVILNNQNEWRYLWDHLEVVDENGDPYYYWVVEEPVEGYSTSYSGNGVINGTVTVTNVRLRTIIVHKAWKNADGSEMTDSEIEVNAPGYIDGYLVQKDLATNATKRISFRLNKDNGWSKEWRCDCADFGEEEGHTYEYTVQEVSVDGYTVTYVNNDGILEGRIEIVNQRKPLFIHISKVSQSGTTTLRDAEFSLYTDASCEAESIVEAYDNEAMTGDPKTVFVTDASGRVSIYGLTPGTYYLKEIAAPEGYLLITEAKGFTLSQNGTVSLIGGGQNDFWSVGSDGLTVIVKNAKIYELPSTGGMGTYPFTACGVFVITTALLFMILKRKEDNERTE